jgi:putative transcriptional regulator|nr:MAG TPA: Cro/C1-type HTH DNA-binding domain protein [Caudoviricetes sp.]
MIKYKIDILEELKNKGYSSYRLRKNKIFGEATIQKIRNKDQINFDNLNKICELLECQPGDLIIYVKDN